LGHNILHGSVQIIEYVTGSNAQNRHAPYTQLQVSFLIPLRAIAAIMGCTINFDSEFGSVAVEVRHVAPCSLLAAKLQSGRPFSQLLPKQDFGEAHGSTQFPRASDCLHISAEHHPSTGFAGPPPLKGRITAHLWRLDPVLSRGRSPLI
jgi:hypothetical protein